MRTMNPQQASYPHRHWMSRFPLVLYSVLQDALTDPELAVIISWELSGTAFRIHDQKSCVENVFPRYFPRMKSYSSLRRQLNLYGILIQSYDPSRTFSFLVSPADNARKNDGLLLVRGVSSSGVYSHPFLRRDRLDLAARIPRTGIPSRRTGVPIPPLAPPPRGSHFGGSTFFIHDTSTSSSSSAITGSCTTGTTTSRCTTTTATTATTTTADAASYAPLSNNESHNNMTDYYYPDKCHSYKNYDNSSSTTAKNRTNFPSNVVLAALDHSSELAAPFFLSPMNVSGGELGLDDHPHYYVGPSSSNDRSSTVIPNSTGTSHTDDDHDDVTTFINDQRQLLPMPSLNRLQEQEYQQSLPLLLRDSTATNPHDEDIRLEIIQTFLYYS